MLSLLKPRALSKCTRLMSTATASTSSLPVPAPVAAAVDYKPRFINIPPTEDPLLHYLASRMQSHGHRARANKTLSRTMVWIHTLTRAQPLPIIREAVFAASPAVRSLSQTQGAKRVAIPSPLNEKQRTRYGVNAILKAVEVPKKTASKNRHLTFDERLAREIIGIVNGNSQALKTKDEIHKLAMVNRGNIQR